MIFVVIFSIASSSSLSSTKSISSLFKPSSNIFSASFEILTACLSLIVSSKLISFVDTSLNDLQNKKQDNLLFTSPLLKDISNNITIDLSAYPLKINVDSSLNDIINTKQDNLPFE